VTADHVLFAFVVFILISLAGVLLWISRAQDHFRRLDADRRSWRRGDPPEPEPLRRPKTDRA
jgi:hypothetical protein